jgi:hypothetical protein
MFNLFALKAKQIFLYGKYSELQQIFRLKTKTALIIVFKINIMNTISTKSEKIVISRLYRPPVLIGTIPICRSLLGGKYLNERGKGKTLL